MKLPPIAAVAPPRSAKRGGVVERSETGEGSWTAGHLCNERPATPSPASPAAKWCSPRKRGDEARRRACEAIPPATTIEANSLVLSFLSSL